MSGLGARAEDLAGGESVESLLERLASGAPAPGGGAAAALTGATAAALVAMVCRVTARAGAAEPSIAVGLDEADQARRRLLGLMAEDERAFQAVVVARRLAPPARTPALARSLRRATEVPLEIATLSGEVLGLAAGLAPHAWPAALGDLAVAVALAGASLEAGALTAGANLGELSDGEFVRATRTALERTAGAGAEARRRASEVIATRTEATG